MGVIIVLRHVIINVAEPIVLEIAILLYVDLVVPTIVTGVLVTPRVQTIVLMVLVKMAESIPAVHALAHVIMAIYVLAGAATAAATVVLIVTATLVDHLILVAVAV